MLARRMQMAAAGSGSAVATYAEILRDTYGLDEVWPLVDISSGTNIGAFVNSNRDGTLSDWSLQNAAGPVSGTNAPLSDGINDYGNIYTSNGTDGFVDIFDPAEFSLVIFLRVSAAGVWTDSTVRQGWRIAVNTSNQIILRKDSASNSITFLYRAGGTLKTVAHTFSDTGWYQMGLSVSVSAGASGEMKAFVNGSQVGSTQTGLGTWAGSLASNSCVLGAFSTTGSASYDGWLAYPGGKFGSILTPTQFSDLYSDASTALPD